MTEPRPVVIDIETIMTRGHKPHPSPTTVRRLWSDGKTDLGCAAIGCQYGVEDTDDGCKSVGNHWGKIHARDTPRMIDVPFDEWHRRRPMDKITVTADLSSNAQIVKAIRKLVGTGADGDELQELRAENIALVMQFSQAQEELRRVIAQRNQALAELAELRQWRDNFRALMAPPTPSHAAPGDVINKEESA